MPKVLIVDDGTLRQNLRELFQQSATDWEISEAACTFTGLAKIIENRPRYIVLGDKHGVKTIRSFREAAPKAVILVYTENSDPNAVASALAAGADEWFVRGTDNGQLEAIIRAGRIRRTHRNMKSEGQFSMSNWSQQMGKLLIED